MGIDPRKQALAAAPNVVHSLDAAMLQLCALALADHDVHGAWIHDSYGVLPNNVELLNQVTREIACRMFSEDVFADLHAGFEELAAQTTPATELPPPPELGDFDVSELLNAPYFFS